MGDELKKDLVAEIELIAGANGIFDVSLDSNMIYSKFEQGHFPAADEIIQRIKEG